MTAYPSVEWSASKILDIIQNWTPGGGGSDPLELQNWLSIGADPAQSGAMRLESGAGITASSSDYSAGSGEAAGDQSLLSLQEYDAGSGNLFTAIRIGDAAGPTLSEMVLDLYWNGGLFTEAGFVSVDDGYNPADAYPADKKMAQLTYSKIELQHSDGTKLVSFVNNAGDLVAALQNIPSTEPGAAGQLWEFTGDITDLTNYLSGGGRLMALGNP